MVKLKNLIISISLLVILFGLFFPQDFKIQRGYAVIPSGSSSVTITAGSDYVSPSKMNASFIRIVNTRLSGMGATSGGTSNSRDDTNSWSAYISNPENLQISITFERHSTDSWDDRISYEIIEYLGPNGGNNEILVRNVSALTYGTSDTTVDSPTVTVSDDSDVVVFITGQASPESGTNSGSLLSTSEWVSGSDLARFTRGDSGSDATDVSYAIVEFIGPNWKIQRTTHNYASAGVEENEALTTALENTSRAFLHPQHRSDRSNPGLDELGAEVWITNTTHLSFQMQSGATTPSDFNEVVWVIENNESDGTPMIVEHISGSRATGGSEEDTWNEPINTISLINGSSVFGESARSTGTGQRHPRGSISFNLSSTTSVELKQADTGQTETYRFSIVQWPIQSMELFVDTTVSSSTLSFGSLDPDTSDNPASENPIVLTNTMNSNIPIDVYLNNTNMTKGTDQIPYFNMSVNTVDSAASSTNLNGTTYLNGTTADTGFVENLGRGSSTNLYFWHDVPDGQAAGTYTSTVVIHSVAENQTP